MGVGKAGSTGSWNRATCLLPATEPCQGQGTAVTERDGGKAHHMSADLPSYSSLLSTSGDMYSGVPQAVLHTEPLSSSLLYPKSHSLMMGSGMLPSSNTLSNCVQE